MIRRSFLGVFGKLPFLSLFNKKPVNEESSDTDVVMIAIGEASMCWEHPEKAGVFESERAEEIGERLRKHFADGIGDFATARRRVCDDIKKDDELWTCYHANLAMTIFDNSKLDIIKCNDIADELMSHIFEAPKQYF